LGLGLGSYKTTQKRYKEMRGPWNGIAGTVLFRLDTMDGIAGTVDRFKGNDISLLHGSLERSPSKRPDKQDKAM
jgi:hypothetical protein